MQALSCVALNSKTYSWCYSYLAYKHHAYVHSVYESSSFPCIGNRPHEYTLPGMRQPIHRTQKSTDEADEDIPFTWKLLLIVAKNLAVYRSQILNDTYPHGCMGSSLSARECPQVPMSAAGTHVNSRESSRTQRSYRRRQRESP